MTARYRRHSVRMCAILFLDAGGSWSLRGRRRGRGRAVHLRRDVAAVVRRGPELGGPVTAGLGLESLEHLGPVGLAEVPQAVGRRPEERHLAAGHEDEQPVAQVEVGHAVRHHDDRAAVVRQLGHLLHDRLVQSGVQARGRLVQEQQRRLGQQFQRDVDALLLAAGQRRGPGVGVRGQRQLGEHLVDPALALLLAGVAREAQLGGELQCTPHRQLGMQDVLLRHQADPVPQLGVAACTDRGRRTAPGPRWPARSRSARRAGSTCPRRSGR